VRRRSRETDEAAPREAKPFTFSRRWAAALRASTQAKLAVALLGLIVGACLVGPYFAADPNALDLDSVSQQPSAEHWFGTDNLGRDYFSRVLSGGRVSLLVGFLAMLATTAIGTLVGLVAGFAPSWVDSLLMRFTDFLASIPWLILVIVVALLMKPGLVTIVIAIGCFTWMSTARLVRAETLSIRERAFVRYAVYIGQRPVKTVAWHVLPDALPTIMVAGSASVSAAMMSEAALSFLGQGIQPPMASWGSLLQIAQGALQQLPHLAVIPGLLIMMTVYSLNALTNVTRQAAEAGQ
jgi:peptide/nickel transport system permease protein